MAIDRSSRGSLDFRYRSHGSRFVSKLVDLNLTFSRAGEGLFMHVSKVYADLVAFLGSGDVGWPLNWPWLRGEFVRGLS